MSATDAWTRLGSVPPADLHDTTLQLHWATQFIAAAGQSFADPKDDDSHRAMTWDANRHAFIGEPFTGGYPFRVAVRPADLVLQLVDQTDEPLGSLPLVGVTMQEGYEWLATGLAHYMGGLPELGRPDFELPEHPVANGAPFSDGRDDELRVLSALFRSAAGLLEALAAPDESASEVRCWPHHFDIATLVTIEAGEDAHSSKTIGIGMAPMGGSYDGWYWYVTPSISGRERSTRAGWGRSVAHGGLGRSGAGRQCGSGGRRAFPRGRRAQIHRHRRPCLNGRFRGMTPDLHECDSSMARAVRYVNRAAPPSSASHSLCRA